MENETVELIMKVIGAIGLIAPPLLAARKGRRWFLWLVAAFFINWIAFLILLFLPSHRFEDRLKRAADNPFEDTGSGNG